MKRIFKTYVTKEYEYKYYDDTFIVRYVDLRKGHKQLWIHQEDSGIDELMFGINGTEEEIMELGENVIEDYIKMYIEQGFAD